MNWAGLMLGGINPWVSMWGEPRSTIRSIVGTDPRFGIIYLASIYFLQSFFYFFSQLNLTASVYSVLILSVVLSPVFGMMWLYFTGAIFYWVGRLLKGRAPMSHVVAALAWSKIPMSISLLMWFILLVAGQGVELLYYPEGVGSVFIVFIASILTLWSWVLLIQSIREVEGFSLGRTLLTLILVCLILSVIFIFFLFLIILYA